MKRVGLFLVLCSSSLLFSSAPAQKGEIPSAKAAAEQAGQAANSQPAAAAGAGAGVKCKYEVSTARTADSDIKTVTMTNLSSGAWVKKVIELKKPKSDAPKNCIVAGINVRAFFEGSDEDVQSLWTKLFAREEFSIASKVVGLINGLKKSSIGNTTVTIENETMLLCDYLRLISLGTASDSAVVSFD